MNSKREFLSFFLFESKVLEQRFAEMAEKGWMLDNFTLGYLNRIKYEPCVPKKYYFYVDFISNYDLWYPNIANEKVLNYRALIEEYGYVFVASYGPMQVFVSEEPIEIEIREESKETKREMRKASLKSVIFTFIFSLLYFWMFLTSFHPEQIYYWSGSSNIMTNIIQFLAFFLFFSFSFPVLHWMLHEKRNYQFWKIKLRTYLQFTGMGIIIFLLCSNLSSTFGFLLLFLFVVVFIAKGLLKIMDTHDMPSWLKTSIVVVACLLFLGLIQGKIIPLSFAEISDRDPYAFETSVEPLKVSQFTKEKDVSPEVNKEESRFIKAYSYCYYYGVKTDEEGYDGFKIERAYSYDITIIKDTPLQGYIQHQILTGNNGKKVTEIGKYAIYENDYYGVFIQKGHILMSFMKEDYHVFTEQELDNIFQEIDKL